MSYDTQLLRGKVSYHLTGTKQLQCWSAKNVADIVDVCEDTSLAQRDNIGKTHEVSPAKANRNMAPVLASPLPQAKLKDALPTD